jgi:hypothetical protein
VTVEMSSPSLHAPITIRRLTPQWANSALPAFVFRRTLYPAITRPTPISRINSLAEILTEESEAQSRLDMFLRSAKDVPHEHRVEIVKDLFLNTVEEKNWPILMPEFKLFAFRNKASLRRIRDLYQLLYDDLSRDLLPESEGFTDTDKEKALVALAVLPGIPSAIALERQFNPVMNLRGATKEVLEAIFESLLKMKGRMPVSSRPKALLKTNQPCKPGARSGK